MGRYSTSLLAFAYLCIVLLGTAAAGQNQSTFLKLYGSPVGDVYQISPRLKMTAEFARSGNLCRAYIGAVDKKITDVELDPVLDQLAPTNARGKLKIANFLDIICPPYDCSGVEENYERLQIARMGSINAYNSVVITYYRHECKGLNKR